MKLKEVFEKSVQFFKDRKIESARLDTELLLSHALKIDRIQIYLKFEQPLSDSEVQICREVVKRRIMGEPVAYIVGEKGFYGEDFLVGPGVLIPRPETELIVEEALKFINENQIENPQILDLGAGSGCIGFSILKSLTSGSLTSIERSEAAFHYLKRNQEKLNLTENSRIIFSDVMSYTAEQDFDVIVANPPYIDLSDEEVAQCVKKFEPHEALFSDDGGLGAIKAWTQKFAPHLKTRGLFLIEHGYLQGPHVRKFLTELAQFTEVKQQNDLSQKERFIKAFK